MILFKVLTAAGRPARGNTEFEYGLPTDGQAGAWTPEVETVVACESGYHLTSRPSSWWVVGGRLFTAESRGARAFEGDKVACASVRLLEEVTPEWQWLPLYPEIRALLFSTWRLHYPDSQVPSWANLSRANLSRADLGGATLSGADLGGADLSRANLSGADLGGADLSRADLSRADLGGADLSRATLSGADLGGADLSGADLSGADLSGADLITLPEGWEVDEHGFGRRVAAKEAR